MLRAIRAPRAKKPGMLRALRTGRAKNVGKAKSAKNVEDVKNTVMPSSTSEEFSFLLVRSLSRHKLIAQITLLVPLPSSLYLAMQLYSGMDKSIRGTILPQLNSLRKIIFKDSSFFFLIPLQYVDPV
jgi:hypothetical protein